MNENAGCGLFSYENRTEVKPSVVTRRIYRIEYSSSRGKNKLDSMTNRRQ